MKAYFQDLTDNLLILFASNYLLLGYVFLTILLVVCMVFSLKLLGIFRHVNNKHYFD